MTEDPNSIYPIGHGELFYLLTPEIKASLKELGVEYIFVSNI